MTKSLSAALTILLVVFALFSCSRKEDDELPARVGDLEVLFSVTDQFGILPDTINIPVILSLYTDTTHAVEVRSESITVHNRTAMSVKFEEMEPTFFYLSIRINVPGLPPPCDDITVFVQYNRLTTTDLVEIEVRAQEIRCR